jgi:hypothetical protein
LRILFKIFFLKVTQERAILYVLAVQDHFVSEQLAELENGQNSKISNSGILPATVGTLSSLKYLCLVLLECVKKN